MNKSPQKGAVFRTLVLRERNEELGAAGGNKKWRFLQTRHGKLQACEFDCTFEDSLKRFDRVHNHELVSATRH